MISYELAKKLKDCGFPQPEFPIGANYDNWILSHTYGSVYFKRFVNTEYIDDEVVTLRISPGMVYTKEYVYIPTLSELIEACGNGLESLKRDYEWKCNYWYVADDDDEKFGEDSCGATPEEAVANLWLFLNVDK